MNRKEFEVLKAVQADTPTIGVCDLEDQGPQENRTLLFGYTCERDTFHVYLMDGEIHRVIYDFEGRLIDHICDEELEINFCIPNKRAYPERTDIGFATIVHERGGEIPFTTFTDNVPEKKFYGKVLDYNGENLI